MVEVQMKQSQAHATQDKESQIAVSSSTGTGGGGGKLIIVSNRLPVTLLKVITKQEARSAQQLLEPEEEQMISSSSSRDTESNPIQDGKSLADNETQSSDQDIVGYKFERSSGGLVTALLGLAKDRRPDQFVWVGWLGKEVQPSTRLEQQLKRDYRCKPVYITQEDGDLYYNGLSNGLLWPLFHYQHSTALFNELEWEAYMRVNQQFADSVLSIYEPGDQVWIHDYHLMLVPEMLVKRRKGMKIGFFLHIPFPSSEIFRTLPVRKEILKGLLGSSLLAFHTHDFARHFLSSCSRILGCDVTTDGLFFKGVFHKVAALPIGICVDRFMENTREEGAVRRLQCLLRDKYHGKHVIVGVDRLDYTKGVDLKLLAFERFLQRYPNLVGDTVLIQIGVPTRERVEQYQQLISTVNKLVGQINSKYGTLDNTPIHYINKSVSQEDLIALYAIADVLLVSSVRDGMNLVSCEFVAVQEQVMRSKLREENGVLMLSEFAGAAKSLGGALTFNPYNIDQAGDVIYEALTMSQERKSARHSQNFKIISSNNVHNWASSFLAMLQEVPVFHAKMSETLPKVVAERCLSCKRRLFLLDIDGTLADLRGKESELAQCVATVRQCLTHLTKDPTNIVYILSGRPHGEFQNHFGGIERLGIVAELGTFVRHPGQTTWVSFYSALTLADDREWINKVLPVVEHYCERTKGATVVQTGQSIIFEYRNAMNPKYAQWMANELKHMMSFHTVPLTCMQGREMILIHPNNMGISTAVQKLIEMYTGIGLGDSMGDNTLPHSTSQEHEIEPIDFLFCAGDDETDEDMFDVCHRLTRRDTRRGSISAPMIPFVSPLTLATGVKTEVRTPRAQLLRKPTDHHHLLQQISRVHVVTCMVGKAKTTKATYSLGKLDRLVAFFDKISSERAAQA